MSDNRLDDLIAHARTDEPTPAQLASLTRRLGPLLGPGGGGAPGGGSGDGGASGGAVGGGAAGKVGLAIGGFGTVAAIVGIALSRTPAATPVRDAAIAVVTIDASLPADAAIDAAFPAPDAAPAPRRSNPPPATDSLAAESAMLDRARQALAASDARRALGVCEDHAHRFPRGVLREERERIAIEALVALGRRREAKARVAAFDRAFPGSVQSERVHALVDSP